MSLHKSHRLGEFQKRAVNLRQVLLIGPLSAGAPPTELMSKCAIVGVDGGAQAAGISQFDFTIGDGDSGVPAQLDELLPQHKDRSDLEHALALIPAEVAKLHLWGFWGARMDHQLCNLGAIHQFLLNRSLTVELYVPGRPLMSAFSAGEHQLDLQGTFSLLSLAETRFSITGACRYSLSAPTLVAPLSSHTLSNEAHGCVIVTSDRPFFCFRESAL